MKISILVSNPNHPVVSYLKKLRDISKYNVEIFNYKKDLRGGDFLFLVSCSEIVEAKTREMFRHTLVLHASDLPKGRGWSPHIWSILEGQTTITLSLLEAQDPVDSGNIWRKINIPIEKHELFDEINNKIFNAEVELIEWAIKNELSVKPAKQDESGVTYYQRRTPADSKVDPYKSLIEQFNILRVSDPDRFPAYFEYEGQRFIVTLKKAGPLEK